MAFVLGFFTSFGWWTAGKVQKSIDGNIVNIKISVEPEENNKREQWTQ
jgi:hypothetical protein